MVERRLLESNARHLLGDDVQVVVQRDQVMRWEAHAINIAYAFSAAGPDEKTAVRRLNAILAGLAVGGWDGNQP